MKVSLIMAGFCLVCLGCGTSPTSEKTNGPSQEDTTYNLDTPGGGGGAPCDRLSYQLITLDGGTYLVEIPSLCNPNPDPYHGDPAPDYQVDPDPWDKQYVPSGKRHESIRPQSLSQGQER